MSQECILVVDDSPEIRETIAHNILIEAGYDALMASSGAEGITLAESRRPDLIISDYVMPQMTGLQMLNALRDRGIDIPMILMTAEGSEELAVESMRAGVRDYLIKPIDAETLLNSVRDVLKRHWSNRIRERIPSHLIEANRKLEQRIRELNTLLSIGTSVTAMLDIQAVLNHIVEAAVNVTGAEEGSLLLFDRSTGELYMRAARNIDHKTVHTLRLKVNDSLAGQVITTGQPVVVSGREGVKIKTSYLVKSLAYVPLRAHGKISGVLGVANRVEARIFGAHEVQILTILADFAAVAMENAQLYAERVQERDTLDAILRDTAENVIVIDTHERVMFCNPTARETFSVTMTDFVGKPVQDVIKNPEVLALLRKESSEGRSTRSEIILDAGEKVLNAQLTILEGIGRAAVMQDITHLKELDRAKSDFVAAVAHDLRSPLTAILGYTELLQRAGPMNEQQDKFVEQIISSVHSITVLITELLELSRIEAGYNVDLEPVALARIAQQAIHNLNHQLTTKGHTLKVEIAPNLPFITGNALRLQQMITNLLGNAIKYTPDKGVVRLAIWEDADLVVLQVADSGIGIPAEDQPYVFDKFFRSERAVNDFEGTGLGLAIVKGIVDQHGGRIWLESKENEGTVFTVVLNKDLTKDQMAETV